jgi:hypothetical protein
MKALNTHDRRGLLDPKDSPDAMQEIMCPCWETNPGSQVVQPVADLAVSGSRASVICNIKTINTKSIKGKIYGNMNATTICLTQKQQRRLTPWQNRVEHDLTVVTRFELFSET